MWADLLFQGIQINSNIEMYMVNDLNINGLVNPKICGSLIFAPQCNSSCFYVFVFVFVSFGPQMSRVGSITLYIYWYNTSWVMWSPSFTWLIYFLSYLFVYLFIPILQSCLSYASPHVGSHSNVFGGYSLIVMCSHKMTYCLRIL